MNEETANLEWMSKGKYGIRLPHSSIPIEVRKLLFFRQAAKQCDCFKYKSYSIPKRVVSSIALSALFLFPPSFVSGERWPQSVVTFFIVVYAVNAAIIARIIISLVEIAKAEFKPHVYVTKLYLVCVRPSEIDFFPLIELKDLKATHNYTNGVYRYTEINMQFIGGNTSLKIKGEKQTKEMMLAIDANRRDFLTRYAAADLEYFKLHNEFIGVDAVSDKPSPVLSGKVKIASYVAAIVLSTSIIAAIAFYNISITQSGWLKESKRKNEDRTTAQSMEAELLKRKKQDSILASLPKLELPESGATHMYIEQNLVAPLSITADNSQHFLVKLVDVSSNQPVMAIFVRSGTRIEVKVPLGTFEIRYASGIRWYGLEYLFGTNTSFGRAEKQFQFTVTESGFSGYSLQLQQVTNGNLKTEKIDGNSF